MMKELLSELYQVLGELDAPAKVLDQVAAAIAGQPLPHATLLPFADEPARTDVARKIIELANDHFENGGSSVLRTANNCIAEIQELARVLLPSVSQAVHVAPQADALPDGDLPDAVIKATAEAIGSAYDCMRTWSAWGVGTMGPDDFLPVADDGDRVAEIARAVIGAWLADQRQGIEPALEAVPAAPAVKESLTADRQAEPVAWFYSDNFDKQDNLYRRTTVRDVAEGFARQGRRVIAQYDAAQPPAVAVAVPEWLTFDRLVNSLAIFVYGATQNPLRDQLTLDHWENTLNDMASQSSMFNAMAAVRAMLAAAQQAAAPLSAALADIAAERRRQIEQERWTPDRDDRLLNGQLATAAGYYALAAGWPHERDIGRGLKPQYWPFNQEWWKPTTARHNLVKAGALIAAEIERIDRAAQKGGEA